LGHSGRDPRCSVRRFVSNVTRGQCRHAQAGRRSRLDCTLSGGERLVPIDLHRFILVCHVGGMGGVFAGLTIEKISVRSFRLATTFEEARQGIALWPLLQRIGLPSYLVILLSGIYLATSLAVWEFSWASVAVPTLVLVTVAAAVLGPQRGRIRAATATGIGP